jgi:membrane-bound metal-dependent hydrolase YbcI (DUF457 family)
MTVFEHGMVGASLALAAGWGTRDGWRVVAVAAAASALPDWDGLAIALGPSAYASGHRTWGHNVFVAALLGGLVGYSEYRFGCFNGLCRRLRTRYPALLPVTAESPGPAARGRAAVWVAAGLLASLSHLPIDVVYSGHGDDSPWPVRLLWPVSTRGWALSIVPWGDIAATLVFVGEMFALYRWPTHARFIAGTALVVVAGYVAVRWWMTVP